MLTKIFAIAAALLAAAPAAAQQGAAPGLDLDVRPTLQALPGGLLRATYVVANLSSSADSLWSFTVDAPAPAVSIAAPDADRWETGTMDHGATVASWGILEGMVGPGQRSPGLSYVALGVPGIVQYRAVRWFPVPDGDESEPDPADSTAAPAPDPLAANTVSGSTVGIVPPPAGGADALAGRLGQLVAQACELGWIDNPGVCNSLRVKAVADAGGLNAMLHELDAQRGKHVSEAAYSLLAVNARYLLEKL
jgi:hypothetical protein